MSEWVKFTGSSQQLLNIAGSVYGVKFRHKNGTESDIVYNPCFMQDVESYLICEPHPHADMIIEWARTGRPVYHKASDGEWYLDSWPHWVSNGEYSFDPPREIVRYKRYLVDVHGHFKEIGIMYSEDNLDSIESLKGFIRWIDKEWQEVEV